MQRITKLAPKKIWHQIGLSFALISAVSLVVLGLLLINASRKAVRDSVLRDYREITGRAANEISSFITKPQGFLISASSVLGMVPASDAETQKMLLYRLITDYPDIFERIALASLDGKEKVSSDFEPRKTDYSKNEAFLKMIDQKNPAISKVYFSPDHSPYITIAVPVKKLDELSMALISEIRLNSIWKIVEGIKLKDSRAFLVDENGYALAHSEEKKIYRGENLKSSPAVGLVLKGENGSIEEKVASEGESEWLSAYAPIAPFGWGLIIRQPIKSAYAFSFRMQEVALIIILLAIISSIILSFLITGWITSPLEELTRATAKVAAGDFNINITSFRDDEIGKLLSSFNGMIQKLQKSRRLEKLSNIGEATSKIAHELRNPLVTLKTFMELLPSRHKDDKFIEQFKKTVPPEMTRLEKMLGTLTAFPAENKLVFTRSNIIQIIKDTLVLFKGEMNRLNIRLETDFEKDSFELPMDTDKIKQVFINLIQNAIESMAASGGVLKLSVRDAEVTRTEPEEKVEIKITDTGCGIRKEMLANIFEPFYTFKKGGLGLGLTICKEIIDLHKGIITAESIENKGTTFAIRLPLRRENGK